MLSIAGAQAHAGFGSIMEIGYSCPYNPEGRHRECLDGRGAPLLPRTMTSWFELRTPQDLLGKLKADCKRVIANPADSHAAFDFFVTAFHISDWRYPGKASKATRGAFVDANPILGVCQHVANGVKHFKLDDPKLKSVTDAGARGTFDQTFDATFDRVRLTLTLDGRAKAEFGEIVDVSEWAPKIVEWWERELAKPREEPPHGPVPPPLEPLARTLECAMNQPAHSMTMRVSLRGDAVENFRLFAETKIVDLAPRQLGNWEHLTALYSNVMATDVQRIAREIDAAGGDASANDRANAAGGSATRARIRAALSFHRTGWLCNFGHMNHLAAKHFADDPHGGNEDAYAGLAYVAWCMGVTAELIVGAPSGVTYPATMPAKLPWD